MDKILLLEDEAAVARSFQRLLEQENYQVARAADSKEFDLVYEKLLPDLILLDIELKNSEFNGLEIFAKIRQQEDFRAKVIVLSAKATRMQVAEAMKMGAINFIEKGTSFNRDKFLADIKQALELSRREKQITDLRLSNLDGSFIGDSEDSKRIKQQILKLAPTNLNILITGETGTGKGVIAELIHRYSKRAHRPYKVVDVKSIPDTLMESELFGHTKGAFTGADAEKKGYFENADQGTLFIDEISNLSLGEQAKLLKVIEEKQIPVVGTGGKNRNVDVRIIAASNQDLTELSNEGKFRNDLYFRLAVGNIHIPPIRQRQEDIIELMNRFLLDCARENKNSLNYNLSKISSDLQSYPWPGNVRELRNLTIFISQLYDPIDNSAIMREFTQLKQRTHKLTNVNCHNKETTEMEAIMQNTDYTTAMNTFEKQYLETQLKLHHNKVSDTANALGLERTTLYKKIKKLGINE
ncbi:MAG: sigma-54 dependent transcriptional regulator [Candidatus Cloacimonetes bacterium]|nr:sigma-54 dependent transcriptional regulator [Candidatus Cloacimonadota bacterium]